LKPEWWGSPLVQEGKPVKRGEIMIIIIHRSKSAKQENVKYCHQKFSKQLLDAVESHHTVMNCEQQFVRQLSDAAESHNPLYAAHGGYFKVLP
jgi:hypothetical protein